MKIIDEKESICITRRVLRRKTRFKMDIFKIYEGQMDFTLLKYQIIIADMLVTQKI